MSSVQAGAPLGLGSVHMASPGRAAWTLPWWPPVRENSPDVLRDSMQKVLDRNGDFADLLWFQKAAD